MYISFETNKYHDFTNVGFKSIATILVKVMKLKFLSRFHGPMLNNYELFVNFNLIYRSPVHTNEFLLRRLAISSP